MKLIHASDIHLGFRSYEKRQGGYNARELDVYKSFASFVSKAVELSPDIVVIAGDLFDAVNPPNRAVRLALMLGNFSCPVIVISGNHDRAKTGEESPVEILRSVGVHVFTEPDTVELAGLKFFCAPYECDLEPADVLIGHLQLEGPREYNFAKTIKIEADNYAYVALGDLHRYWTQHNMVYCGTISRLDFSQEGKPVGFLEVDISDTEDGSIKYHELPSREFVTVRKLGEFTENQFQDKIVRLIIDGENITEEGAAYFTELFGLEELARPFHLKIVRKKLKTHQEDAPPQEDLTRKSDSIVGAYTEFTVAKGKPDLIDPGVRLLKEKLGVSDD